MSLPTKADLEALQQQQNGPCISLYMPAHPKGRDAEQDPLRFRMLLDTASDELAALGERPATIDKVLQPGRDLNGDRPFWSRLDKGLAIFLAPDRGRILNLPFTVPELLVSGTRFHLSPLVFALQPDLEYYVLALSRRGVRLLKGSRLALEEVSLRGAPEGLEDVTAIVESERPFQARTAAREGPRTTLVYHGHGGEHDDDDERLLEYFRAIDSRVQEVLNPTQAPLVLAGISYLLPLYRQATGYGHIVDPAADTNPDTVDDAELHDLTWPIVEPSAYASAREREARLQARVAKDESAIDLGHILEGALQGRVEAIFVAGDAVRWGRFVERHLDPHEQREPGDEDLLDRAVLETLKTGGCAYSLARPRMPEGAEAAAIFRY